MEEDDLKKHLKKSDNNLSDADLEVKLPVAESSIWKLYRLIEDRHFAQQEKEHLSSKGRNKHESDYWLACAAATEYKNLISSVEK